MKLERRISTSGMTNPIIKFLVVGSLVLLILTIVLACAREKLYGIEDEATLRGYLTVETFLDANDYPEKSYILKLDKAIDVEKDEFGGPTYDVKQVQLVVYGDIKIDVDKYINREITLKGKLFHSHTAHHHTKVLLEIEQIIE